MERNAAISVHETPSGPERTIANSTLAFDQPFTTTAKGLLLLAEILSGTMVWILIAGTEYFHVPALCWVMFVAILFWLLTIFLFIIYLIGAHKRMPFVPWNTVSLCLNCSAAALYLLTAAIEALSVSQATRGRHNYRCWAASTFFSFLSSVLYTGSSFLSYRAWNTARGGQEN
ncbi:CKLF-like MARVEL transmembrane domain-containing protein 8b [Takifugu rubripes]|nr:CKLF-like MARVEL transmembrane domain-containing protein 8 [Takifugu rubripes]|eukprot:XP_003966005.2 PREDICTED: CKLF-like MARVEL transmembrane domain-containing protein 8 [Takifugu rubripes]